MKKRFLVLAAAAVAVAVIAAGCSQSEGGSGELTSLEVTLREFSIEPSELHAPEGVAIAMNVTNAGHAPHAFAVEAAGRTMETPLLDGGELATLEIPALEAGSYRVWCTVPGHEQAGMLGTLEVGEPSEAPGAADLGEGLTAGEMAEGHHHGVAAFPAATKGVGNRVLKPTIDDGVKVFMLVAEQIEWEVEPGKIVEALAYNGQIPGPQIRVRQDDRVRFVLDNQSPQPTVIHFHGLTVPNEMDGVPYVTQDPVMPGSHFVYEFKVVDPPGTYMYHSHFNSTEQVGRGMFGFLIIEPERPTWDVEHTVMLSDGPLGFAINGKGFPATAPLAAELGDTVLIRFANAGQQLHPFHLHGYHFTVVAQDGMILESPYTIDTLTVAPGERYDAIVEADYPGVWAFHCHILSHVEDAHGMFGMVTVLAVE